MPTKEEIEKALGDIPPAEYPRDLRTATRAEFVTLIRKSKPPRDGCRRLLFIIAVCAIPTVIGGIAQLISMIF